MRSTPTILTAVDRADRVLQSRVIGVAAGNTGASCYAAPSSWRKKSNHWTNQSPRSRLPISVLKGIIDNARDAVGPLRPSVRLSAATAIFNQTAFVIFMRAFCPLRGTRGKMTAMGGLLKNMTITWSLRAIDLESRKNSLQTIISS